MISSEVLGRIPEITDWDNLLAEVCSNLDLGSLQTWAPIEAGLEDANIKISTDRGQYLFKGFASSRPQSEVDRYAEIFSAIASTSIPHPKLLTQNGNYVNRQDGVQYGVYEWVEGKSFYDLGRTPDDYELQTIIKIAADLNKLSLKPTFIDDSWAVYNLPNAYNSAAGDLSDSDRAMVSKALNIFSQIDHDALPHTFVHGDITQQNLIVADDGEIFLVDFGVANYYPRVQELALMAALLLDKTTAVHERGNYVSVEYQKHTPLTESEKQALFPYIIASQAMEILGVYRERARGSKLDELDYWLDIGRQGLAMSLGEIG